MSGKNFTLKILTPVGLFLETSVESVKIPTVEGEIGVLPQHTSYAGLLGTGTLQYVSSSAGTKNLSVTGGVVRFEGETLSVLADTVQE